MIKNYLLITARNMMKNKVFIIINVLGIGIAVACCIVSYLNIQFDREWDKGQKNAASIYRIQFWYEFGSNRSRHGITPMPVANNIRQNFKDVDKVVRYMPEQTDFRIGDQVFNTEIAYADSAFFELFTFELKYGAFSDFHDKSRIFINDELARNYFKREDVVGQPLTQMINGRPKEYIIGGVFKKQPGNSSFHPAAYTLLDNYWDVASSDPSTNETNWKRWNTTFLQIKDPGRLPSITERLKQFVAPQNKAREDFKVKEFYLEPFVGIAQSSRAAPRLDDEWLRGGIPKEAVNTPAIMAVLLLLLACFNFTNTSIAVSSQRLKEIGIRKVMGSMRKQLVLQFLGENLLMCFAGLIAGMLMAEWLVPAYDNLWPWLDFKLSYSDNAGFLLFLFVLLIGTALVAGSYPAFYITKFEPIAILKGKLKFGGTNLFTRVLLCLQFSISVLSITFAVAFYGNAEYQRNYDLGFSTSGIISAWPGNEGAYNTYRDALASNPDIRIIAGTKNHIATNFYDDPVKYGSLEKEVDIMDIGDNYMEAMDMKLIEGRKFQKDSKTDQRESVIVSEEFVKQFEWKDDPIGKRVVWMDTNRLYVVGVIKDVYARALWRPLKPLMLRYTKPSEYKQIVIRTDPAKAKIVNDYMEKKWKEVFPNLLYNGQFIDQELTETLSVNGNIVTMFSFLGIVAILLSSSGLYTLVSLNILKKMKEIGVRKVLGASRSNIARVINLEFVIILSIAALFGGFLGYMGSGAIMKSIWEYYKLLDPVSFALSVAFMFGVAGIAVGFKTLATASMNPVKTLRDE